MKKLVALVAGSALVTGFVLVVSAAAKHVWKPSKAQVAASQKIGQPVIVTNSIGMKFVLIPAGSFMMGSPATEKGRNSGEGPRHRVTLSRSFYLQATEVTQSQWLAVMGSNPSQYKGRGDRPVENITHKQALEFIRRLNQREGTTKYRLPTEAEWEYACRAGTTTAYSCGDSPGCLTKTAWYAGNSGSRTHPVGQKRPNPWGLYDMHGNVWEWCSDWYAQDYYDKSPSTDPKGPAKGFGRVIRGGACYNKPKNLRCALRSERGATDRNDSGGFRVVRDY